MAPPPGRMPSSEPRAVPRSTGMVMRLRSSRVSQRFLTVLTPTSRPRSFSRLRRISAMPKMPTATATKLSPPNNSRMPKVKRGVPV
ncbi:hypothetical protein D9M68_819110 [compost metagenome]